MAVYRDSRNEKKIRFQYSDWRGQRRTCTPPDGTTWAEAQRMFREVQSRHDLIRRGIEPEPREPEQVPVAEALIEYLRLGKQRGMNQKKVRPWSPKHVALQERMQRWVLDAFNARFVYELDRVKIEHELDKRHAGGVEAGGEHGKTSNNYASALHTFLSWCVSRGYIDADPMQHWTPYDETPSFIRRAPTVEEVQRVLAVVPEERKLLYQVAICSGFRANELRQLQVRHLTDDGLDLPADIAKNRKSAKQPLPGWLVAALRKANASKFGMHRLLHVPKEAAKTIRSDFRKAGITENLDTLDFHGFGRVGFVNLTMDAGATVKETMVLARHSTPELTLNTYGRARDERLREITEKVGEQARTDGDRAEAENEGGEGDQDAGERLARAAPAVLGIALYKGGARPARRRATLAGARETR